jgi:hypothetical protein
MKLLDLDDLSPHNHRTININGRRLASELRSASAASGKSLLRSFVERVEMRPDFIRITICVRKLTVLLGAADASSPGADAAGNIAAIDLPHQLKRRGVEARLIVGNGRDREPRPDNSLIMLIAKAHRWLDQLTSGNASSITALAAAENEDRNEISRYLPLAFLAPDIVENILRGTQPADLTVEKLRRMGSLPHQWDVQRTFLGFAD